MNDLREKIAVMETFDGIVGYQCADAILALPELQQVIEDAEKWRAFKGETEFVMIPIGMWTDYKTAKEKYDSLTEGLEAEDGDSRRPLTDEERDEVLDFLKWNNWKWNWFKKPSILLSNGVRIVKKGEK